MDNDNEKIRITLDDLERVKLPGSEPRDYGSIAGAPEPAVQETSGALLRKAWFYLGLAGLTGSLAAWAICEHWFVDGAGGSWANFSMFPLMLILICVGFGTAESVVEHSPRKAALRGLLSLAVGAPLGFFFFFVANIIFNIGLAVLAGSGGLSPKSPAFWITRGIAWMGFGVAGGVVYGIVGRSAKKCLYGLLGGVIGAGLGGTIFDPISLATGGAGLSRAVGMALFGAATGIAVGLVESALKDRWLYVAAGPLAGKQFILYKAVTTVGSEQACDIYLFKDPAIQRQHAAIELRGARAFLRALGPVNIQGRPVHEVMLQSGDHIQIGRYSFQYQDRERAIR